MHDSGQLKTNAFSATGGQECDGIVSCQNVVYNGFLAFSKVGIAPVFRQYVFRILQGLKARLIHP